MLKRNHLIAIAVCAGIIIIILGVLGFKRTAQGKLVYRWVDHAPEIALTWTPGKPVTLRELKMQLRITDDYGIDFTSYRFTVVELGRTLDFPVEGLIGREWEQPISLSLVSDHPNLVGKEAVTIRVSVADDVGRKTEIEQVIPIVK